MVCPVALANRFPACILYAVGSKYMSTRVSCRSKAVLSKTTGKLHATRYVMTRLTLIVVKYSAIAAVKGCYLQSCISVAHIPTP